MHARPLFPNPVVKPRVLFRLSEPTSYIVVGPSSFFKDISRQEIRQRVKVHPVVWEHGSMTAKRNRTFRSSCR